MSGAAAGQGPAPAPTGASSAAVAAGEMAVCASVALVQAPASQTWWLGPTILSARCLGAIEKCKCVHPPDPPVTQRVNQVGASYSSPLVRAQHHSQRPVGQVAEQSGPVPVIQVVGQAVNVPVTGHVYALHAKLDSGFPEFSLTDFLARHPTPPSYPPAPGDKGGAKKWRRHRRCKVLANVAARAGAGGSGGRPLYQAAQAGRDGAQELLVCLYLCPTDCTVYRWRHFWFL